MTSPYQILGIPTTATVAQIRAAHRRLVVKLHPDATQNSNLKDQNSRRLALINAARDAIITKSGKFTPLAKKIRRQGQAAGAGSASRAVHTQETIYRDGRPVGSIEILYAEATNAAMRELLEQLEGGEYFDFNSILGAGLTAAGKAANGRRSRPRRHP